MQHPSIVGRRHVQGAGGQHEKKVGFLPMPHQRITLPSPALQKAERAILFQLLRDDHAECWERAELEAEIPDIPAADFLQAAVHLREQKLVGHRRSHLWAAPCVRYLDALEMVSV
jgi:hypothetical protein